MSGLHPTRWRFRHWQPDPDGGPLRLVWVSGRGELAGDGVPLDDPRALQRAQRGDVWVPNALVDQGEEDILKVFFLAATPPTQWWGRLYNDTPVETDTLATLVNEVVGGGYPGTNGITRDALGFPAVTQPGGTDWQVSTRTVSWINNGAGAWTSATVLALATAQSGTTGRFHAWASLSATRTLAVNDQLDASALLTAA